MTIEAKPMLSDVSKIAKGSYLYHSVQCPFCNNPSDVPITRKAYPACKRPNCRRRLPIRPFIIGAKASDLPAKDKQELIAILEAHQAQLERDIADTKDDHWADRKDK